MGLIILRQGFLLDFIQPAHLLVKRIVLDIEQMLNDDAMRVIDERLQVIVILLC